MSYNVGVVRSDMGGCFQYRVLQPFTELKRFDVDYRTTAFLPKRVGEPHMDTLVRWVEQFDVVIIQRCFNYDIFKQVRRACDIAGRKLIFETDDDYLNLPPYNPCYLEISQPGIVEGFKNILRESDHVTVSTQELKDVYYLYNKNITVLPNNIESVILYKDEYIQPVGPDGKVNHQDIFNYLSYPSFVSYNIPNTTETKFQKLFRVGYTATPTHREDYMTIKYHFEKFLKMFPDTVVFYFGDEWFPAIGHPSEHKNVVFKPNCPHDLYMQNIRNLDLGIAPLVPNVFNMGKSSLKLLEYGSWGIPAVAPKYITYARHFEHEKTAMLYENGKEFYDYICEMAQNHQKRLQLGMNAAQMIHETRTERANAQERFDFYKNIIEGTPKVLRFSPNKELASAQTTT